MAKADTSKRTSRRSTSRQSSRGSRKKNPSKAVSSNWIRLEDAYQQLRESGLEPNEVVQRLTALLCQWPSMPSWIRLRRKNSDGKERVPVEDWQNELLILTVEFDDVAGNDCLGIRYTGYSHPSLSDRSGGPAEILVRATDVEREVRRIERGEHLWGGNNVISDYSPIEELQRETAGRPRTPQRLAPTIAAPTSAPKKKRRKVKQPSRAGRPPPRPPASQTASVQQPEGKVDSVKAVDRSSAGQFSQESKAEGWQARRLRKALKEKYPPDGNPPVDMTLTAILHSVEGIFERQGWKFASLDTAARLMGRRGD
jgi:hypothetical protein